MRSNIETIMDLCKLASDTFRLPTYIVSSDGKIIFKYMYKIGLNPLYNYENLNYFKSLYFNPSKKYSFPIIKENYLLENFIVISVMEKDEFKGSFIMGPSTPKPISDFIINGLINDLQAFSHREGVFNYYNSIPVIENKKLINISIMLFYMINKTLIPPENVLNEGKNSFQPIEKTDSMVLSVSKGLQKGSLHHNPIKEKMLFDHIKEGCFEEFSKYNFVASLESYGVVLSKNSYIRSLKNNLICMITLACRSAIEGGLNSEVAFTLSDRYIIQLDDLNGINEINKLAKEVLFTFAKKVSQAKNEGLSKTIIMCKSFIFSHIYEKFSHEDIAKAVGVSSSYLSILFKKEVGISVTEYIQKTKISEAKTLINYSNTPLPEICSSLNFVDQSYFTKVFKKFTGLTPKQYREKAYLIKE
ncbi:MAG: helix-turn-helix domain-containing protein [Clostridiaceae bacterium]